MQITKEKILSEIRRLAAANGGTAVGRERFESETGMPMSAWYGTYWERWSEAVQEAGFKANQMTAALSVDSLLESLALLTREKKRIPTYVQLRMKARKTPGFPAHSTFGRLGSKIERTAKLLQFSRAHAEFEDVAAICEKVLANSKHDVIESVSTADADGFVYLFKSGRRYKFGFTNDPDRRIRELAFQTSEPIHKVHVIHTDDPSGIEGYWKDRFKDKCVHNEWFDLSAKDVATFKRRKKFM